MKLEISGKKITRTMQKHEGWRIHSSNQLIVGEIKEEIVQFLESNDSGSKMYQNLWETVKAALKQKWMAVKAQREK